MDLMLLLLVVLAILIIITAISVMKKLIKIAFILGLIFLVIFLITGGSIVRDFTRLKERIPDSSTIVLLEDNGEIITGFIDSSEIELITDISDVNKDYTDGNLKGILGEHYKVFVISLEKLEELGDIEINNKFVTNGQIMDFFRSGDEIESITFEDLTVDIEMKGKDIRAGLFAYLYAKEIKMTKSPIFFFRNYKDGKIIVYPESMFFRYVKFVPISWIDAKLNKLKVAVADKVKEAID